MRYFVFLDESGEASIKVPDPLFDIFVLCGIVFREDHYTQFEAAFRALKIKYFGTEDIVFHSIKMRGKEGAFRIFEDPLIQANFYVDIGLIFTNHHYTVLSTIVDKPKYRVQYPNRDTAYEDSLTFICERAIKVIGAQSKQNVLHFCLESRGERKDRLLKKIYTHFVKYGTSYMSTSAFQVCHPKLFFREKAQNINGLQFADLCAYPIARLTLTPNRAQPTYKLFEPKIYSNWLGIKKGYGLKYFP